LTTELGNKTVTLDLSETGVRYKETAWELFPQVVIKKLLEIEGLSIAKSPYLARYRLSWLLALGSWLLALGSWLLALGSWRT
jgi:hypothetical protein